MDQKNQTEKKERPLLSSVLALAIGILFFCIADSHDLELFFVITLPGRIVFPILGVLSIFVSITQFLQWRKTRKK